MQYNLLCTYIGIIWYNWRGTSDTLTLQCLIGVDYTKVTRSLPEIASTRITISIPKGFASPDAQMDN